MDNAPGRIDLGVTTKNVQFLESGGYATQKIARWKVSQTFDGQWNHLVDGGVSFGWTKWWCESDKEKRKGVIIFC